MAQEFYFKSGERLRKQYTIQRSLARGGFGEVYEAFDEHLGCKVAIKHVFVQLSIEQLRREVIILVNHARKLGFMPVVYDHWKGDKGTGYFIVMDFVEGKTLDEIRPLPWESDQIIAFLRRMLRNLHDLHSCGITHCDIKPVNIKETPPNNMFSRVPYMLLDFGIAKQGNQTTIRAYSPEYAAPEQYPEHRHELPDVRVGPRTDLYSLAATAYYLLTGKPPVTAKRRFLKAIQGKDDTPISPDDAHIVAGIRKGLKDTLFEMMHVLPAQRPLDALAALKLLDQKLVEDEVVIAVETLVRLPSTPPKPNIPPEPKPVPVAPPALPTVGKDEPRVPLHEQSRSIGDDREVGEVAVQIDRQRKAPSTPIAIQELPQPDAEAFAGVELQAAVVAHTDNVHSLALLPGGPTLAALGQSLQLWSVETETFTPGPLIDMGGAQPRAAAASPAEQLFAVVVGDSLQLHHAGTGEVLRTGQAQLAQARGVTFSADGRQLLLIETDAIAVYDVHTGALVKRFALGDARTIDNVALAADGSQVALYRAGTITLLSLASGAELCTFVLPAKQDATALALAPGGSRLAVATFDKLIVWKIGDDRADMIGRQITGRSSVHTATFGSNGNLLASLHSGDAHFWRVSDTTVEHVAVARGHSARINDIVIAADATSAITAACDNTLRLWRLPEP